MGKKWRAVLLVYAHYAQRWMWLRIDTRVRSGSVASRESKDMILFATMASDAEDFQTMLSGENIFSKELL